MILNLAGVAFAITAITVYCINMGNVDWNFWSMCDRHSYDYQYYYRGSTTASPPERELMQEKCLEGKALILVSVVKSSQQSKCNPVV